MLTSEIIQQPSFYKRFIRVVTEFVGGLAITPKREVVINDVELGEPFESCDADEFVIEAIQFIKRINAAGLTIEITKFVQPDSGMGDGNYIVNIRPNYTQIRKSLDLAAELKELAKQREKETQ